MNERRGAHGLSRLLRGLHWVEDGLLISLIVGALLISISQIMLRNSGAQALLWADQALNITVLWIAMAGGLLATRESNHISIDLGEKFLPARWCHYSTAVAFLVTSLCCLVTAYFGAAFVLEERSYGDLAFLTVPVWVCQAIIPIGLGIIGLRFAAQGLQRLLSAPQTFDESS